MTRGRRVALDSTIAWQAVRSSGGSLSTAARALGISPLELIEVLRADPPMRLGIAPGTTSGLRRRMTVDDDGDSENGA